MGTINHTELTAEEAEAAMVAATARVRQKADEYVAFREQLERLEVQAGQEVAAGAAVTAHARDLAEARESVGIIVRATDVALGDWRASVAVWRRSRSVRPRAEAAEMRGQAAELLAEEARLLKKLRERMGCDYEPKRPPLPDRVIGSDGQAFSFPSVVVVEVPKYRLLLDEAEARERTAGAMEREADRVPAGGTVEASSLDELLDEIFADAARLGPAPHAVVDWIKTADAAGRQRLADFWRRHPEYANELEASRARFVSARTAAIERIYAEDQLTPTRKAEGMTAESWAAKKASELERMHVMARQIAPDAPAADAPLIWRLVWKDGVIDERASRAYHPLEEHLGG